MTIERIFSAGQDSEFQADKRRWVRQRILGQAVLELDDRIALLGTTRDISLGGAYLQVLSLPTEVSAGQRGMLRLAAEKTGGLEFPCTVARVDVEGLALNFHDRQAAFGAALVHDLLELMNGISAAFANSLELKQILQASIDHIRVYLEAEAASLFLLEGREMICKVCSGPVDITGHAVPMGQGVIGRAVREGKAQIVADTTLDPDFFAKEDEKNSFVTRSLLCAPLVVRGQTFGAVELLNKQDGQFFSETDRYILTALAAIAALAIDNARQFTEVLERERIKRELELARSLQQSFLPPRRPDAFPVHGFNLPAREVSGDFFDIRELPDNRIFFALGDVSGKGVNAGLYMTKTISLLHYLCKHLHHPGRLLEVVNRELVGTARLGMFVTLTVGVFDPGERRVWLANAGHTPALLFDPLANAFTEIPGEGLPLGIVGSQSFPVTELLLPPESGLYIYSDGVTEAVMDEAGSFLGDEGLRRLISDSHDQPATQQLHSFISALQQTGRELHDDVTLVVIHAGAEAAPGAAS